MSGRRPPFRSQPKITGDIQYKAELYDGEKPMGELSLLLMKNFDAVSSWKGEFDIDGTHYKVEPHRDKRTEQLYNSFSGNIYPLKIYEDENSRDRSKLYVLNAGLYELAGAEGQDRPGGTAYVNAWVSKKLEGEGTLSIPQFHEGKNLILKWGPIYPVDK